MSNKGPKEIYRALLFICAVYFIAVSFAHQLGMKNPAAPTVEALGQTAGYLNARNYFLYIRSLIPQQATGNALAVRFKIPMLFVFYNIPSERYQDLIISFLSFGWSMLFAIGFLEDRYLRTSGSKLVPFCQRIVVV